MKQYQSKLGATVERETALAREALRSGKPDKAKFYLRLKKRQQSVIDSTYTQLGNLEQLIGTIEFKLIEKDVLYGLEQGNLVLKTLNSEMSVEKIDRVLDDLEDERLRVDEVSDMLGLGLSNLEEYEVDAELAALEREVTESKNSENPGLLEVSTKPEAAKKPLLPEVPTEPLMPDAPKKPILADEETEEPQPLPA